MKYVIAILLAVFMTSCLPFGPYAFSHEYKAVDTKTGNTLNICSDSKLEVGDKVNWGVNIDNVAIYSPSNDEHVATITKILR